MACDLEIGYNLIFELRTLVYEANSCSSKRLTLSIRLDLFLILVLQDCFAFLPYFDVRRCWEIILIFSFQAVQNNNIIKGF